MRDVKLGLFYYSKLWL